MAQPADTHMLSILQQPTWSERGQVTQKSCDQQVLHNRQHRDFATHRPLNKLDISVPFVGCAHMLLPLTLGLT